jgi:hypothetical protein
MKGTFRQNANLVVTRRGPRFAVAEEIMLPKGPTCKHSPPPGAGKGNG